MKSIIDFLSCNAAAAVMAHKLFGWTEEKLKEELSAEYPKYLEYLEYLRNLEK